MKREITDERFKHLRTSSEPISDKEKEAAFALFMRTYQEQTAYAKRTCTQLRGAREALQLTGKHVANRLSMNETTYRSFETGESDGTISLKNLGLAAAAMDCELVYEIRHKSGKPFHRVIWEIAFEASKNAPQLSNCTIGFRHGALNWQISQKLSSTKFRREMGWTVRRAPR